MVFDRLTRQIWDDLRVRFPRQRKTQRDKLAVLVATMSQVKSANLMALGSGLPIRTADALSRFQWIKRFLGDDLVDIDAVMGPFSQEALALASADGTQPVRIIDQSTITQLERHELVMVARHTESVPLARRVWASARSRLHGASTRRVGPWDGARRVKCWRLRVLFCPRNASLLL